MAAEVKTDLLFLQRLVRDIARAELLPRFADVQRQAKDDGSIVTEVDLAMQRRIQEALVRHWPEIDFLGEEMSREEHERLAVGSARALWCLDPLDGTSNYAAGIPYFSVSLALLANGRPELAVVYDPLRDECFSGQRGAGAWLNGSAVRQQPPTGLAMDRCIGVVDFKRLGESLAARLGSRPPYGSQRNFGSSALDWCWLAQGRFHVYLHGGQKLWDYAAGGLILDEVGGYSATLDGEGVFSMSVVPRSVVAACDANLFRQWSDWLMRNR